MVSDRIADVLIGKGKNSPAVLPILGILLHAW